MDCNPQESLENTTNTMSTLLGVHPYTKKSGVDSVCSFFWSYKRFHAMIRDAYQTKRVLEDLIAIFRPGSKTNRLHTVDGSEIR